MMPQNPDNARRRFATAAMAGVAVYVLVDVVLQFLPPHYSVVSEAESNLAVGPYGWIMNLNFLGRAVTTLCAIVAINRIDQVSGLRRAGVLLMATGGLCSAALAFFPTDIDAGSGLHAVTTAGTVHLYDLLGLAERVCLAGVLGWVLVVCGAIRKLPLGTWPAPTVPPGGAPLSAGTVDPGRGILGS